MKKYKIALRVIILTIFIFPLYVNAERPYACIKNNGSDQSFLYYIRSSGSKVDYTKITMADINGIDNQYPPGCFCSGNVGTSDCLKPGTKECASEYQFEVQNQGSQCVVTNANSNHYTYQICPFEEISGIVGYIRDSGMQIISNGWSYTINLSFQKSTDYSKYGNQIKVKDTESGKEAYFNGGKASLTLGLGTDYNLQFYLVNSKTGCDGTELGYIRGSIPAIIKNELYDSETCKNFRKENNSSFTRALFTYCDTQYIYPSERIENEIVLKQKIDEAKQKALALSPNNVEKENRFTCDFVINNNDTNIIKKGTDKQITTKVGFLDIPGYQLSGNKYLVDGNEEEIYWTAYCTETIEITYDDPKALNVGRGFGYNAKITINRQCEPVKIKEPEKKSQCQYGVEAYGYGHNGWNGAGPNDDFDSCVLSCDGGTYSQSCINSCYKKVYQSDHLLSTEQFTWNSNQKMSKLTNLYSSDNAKLSRIAENQEPCNGWKFLRDYSPNDPLDQCYYVGKDDGLSVTGIYALIQSSVSDVQPDQDIIGKCRSENYNRIDIEDEDDGLDTAGFCENQDDNIPTRNAVSSNCVVSGNEKASGCGIRCFRHTDEEESAKGKVVCRSEHGVLFNYFDGCNGSHGNGVRVYEVYKDPNCSDGEEYKKEIDKSIAQLQAVEETIQSFSATAIAEEEYQIIVDEDYNLQKDDKYLSSTTVFSNKNISNQKNKTITCTDTARTSCTDKVELTKLQNVSVNKTGLKVINNVSGLSNDYKQKLNNIAVNGYTISRTIDLSIGAAYLSKSSSNIHYNTTLNLTDSDYDKRLDYHKYENKYFTRLNTRIINNYKSWPYFDSYNLNKSIESYTPNIHVRLYNIGSWNQWGTEGNGVNIDCIYGTAPGIIVEECPPGEDCDDEMDPNGIRYIFRPINLGDMFPNDRSPRFNWTGTITNGKATGAAIIKEKSLYGYDAVDPETLIKTIEAKNESIYEVTTNSLEIDYEFVLTKENIRNIRKYNKNIRDYNGDGNYNYLDYNMSCYTNARGQEVCTSRFLDNINGNSGTEEFADNQFITYSVNGYGIDARKSIAGCNNAINGTSCDKISK